MTATGLTARVGYGIVAFPIGAALGFAGMMLILTKIGDPFYEPHSSMVGFSYFMLSAATALTFGIIGLMVGLTLPWKRKPTQEPLLPRVGISLAWIMLLTLVFIGQGHPLIFIIALDVLLLCGFWFTYVQYGLHDEEPIRSKVQ